MKPYKIILALIISFIVLLGVRTFSNRNVYYNDTIKTGEVELAYENSPFFKKAGNEITFKVSFSGVIPSEYFLAFYYKPANLPGYQGEISFSRKIMTRASTGNDYYFTEIEDIKIGDVFYYYINLEDTSGVTLASLPPEHKNQTNQDYAVQVEGKRSMPLLLAHIVTMFCGLLFVVLAFLTSFEKLDSKSVNIRIGRQFLWGLVFFLMATFGVGILINYKTYGVYWQGYPWGNAFTPTALSAVCLYWLIIIVLMKGSIFAKDPSRNILKPNGIIFLSWLGFVLTIAAFLMPHSAGAL